MDLIKFDMRISVDNKGIENRKMRIINNIKNLHLNTFDFFSSRLFSFRS